MIKVFLPIKKISQRVPNKNFREIADSGESLASLKIKSLASSPVFDEIFISTMGCDDVVESIVNKSCPEARVRVVERPAYLHKDTSTCALSNYAGTILGGADLIVWTHVTSPFLKVETMVDAISKIGGEFDSALAVRLLRSFLIYQGRPLNFGASPEYWPQSQDLEYAYEVTSGFFIAKPKHFVSGHRIGDCPLLHEVPEEESMDIDWPDEFASLERLIDE